MDEIENLKARIKKKRMINHVSKQSNTLTNENFTNHKLFGLLSKFMILVILFLGVMIYTKITPDSKTVIYDKLFSQNFSFAYVNNLYNKYLGGILPFQNLFKETEPVFNEQLYYKDTSIYKDGVMLTVDKAYLVPIQESGIVVFLGEKEGYGPTVIIQQTDGIDLWYSNLKNINVSLYDYVEKGKLLGEVIDNKLYLVYKKEGKVLDYKDYLN